MKAQILRILIPIVICSIVAIVVIINFNNGNLTRDTEVSQPIEYVSDFLFNYEKAKNNIFYSSLVALLLVLVVRVIRPKLKHRKIIRRYVFPITIYIMTGVFYLWSGVFAGTFIISEFIDLMPGAETNWVFCILTFVEGFAFWYFSRYLGTLFRVKS